MFLPKHSDWNHLRTKFQEIWGHADFRSPQAEVIQCLLAKQDAIVVMPTGGGKSICFQLPALLSTGITLVISPLVALMENQVQELQDRQLPAALLHSELPDLQRQQILRDLENQTLRLLYLSPETLLTSAVWQRLCHPDLVINSLILDEAHCLVQWGETFRPAYRRLGTVRSALLAHKPAGTEIAIAAFTATADPAAQQTICQVLQLNQPQTFLESPYRSNLNLTVQTAWTPRQRRQKLWQFIQNRPGKSGLVYVRTRQTAEELATWLQQKNLKTAAYHAALSPQARRELEADWISGKLPFVICTSAFGMGINARNGVRWIVHFHAPLLLSEYVQEIGRAGRDGWQAEALMLVSEPTGWLDPEDKQRQQFFQNQDRKQRQTAQALLNQLPIEGDLKSVSRQFKEAERSLSLLHASGQLQWRDPFHYVIDRRKSPYPTSQTKTVQYMNWLIKTNGCRWKFILEAFGFDQAADALKAGCGHCDRCLAKNHTNLKPRYDR